MDSAYPGGLSRRHFLSRALPAGAALAAGAAGLPALVRPARAQTPAAKSDEPTVLRVIEKDITVNGRTGKAFRIEQPDGTWGYTGERGQTFHVVLENQTGEPTGVHWHGLIVPNDQDGVPFVTQAPIPPGGRQEYKFPLTQAGTHWMHSHFHLQLQRGLSAPLIVREPGEAGRDTEVVMFLSDWTFRDPKVIWTGLRQTLQPDGGYGRLRLIGAARAAAAAARAKGAPKGVLARDINDVDYDAFLTNGRTLADPEVVKVQPGQTVRIRAINAAASSNFFLMLGTLTGKAIAVDGQDIAPVSHGEFELAMGQRIDVRVTIPAGEGAYPIFAQGEGTNRRTGLLLATPRAAVPKLGEEGPVKIDELGFGQELRLRAIEPLPKRAADRILTVNLEGSMADFVWKINGRVWPDSTPLPVRKGERVEMIFYNKTGMDHPMHLHGHVFQVMDLGGSPIAGAKRDTILLNAGQSARIQFDADNPGVWLLHCHVLFHEKGGMMTTVNYEGFPVPDFGPRQ